MKLVHYWQGAFGRYEVPAAIIWLANEANRLVKLPSVEDPKAWPNIGERERSPGFQVIAEWGVWRDDEEERRLRAEVAA